LPANIRAGKALSLALLLAPLLALALVLAGCNGKPPVLSRVLGRVIYVHDSVFNRSLETLGVYLVASDPDGMENLSAFYVINDDAQLFWKVERSAWVSATAEGESWVGTASLAMPGTRPVPPGEYRVVLQSNDGATVEDSFTVPAREVAAAAAKFPTASVEAGHIKVSAVSGPYEVWVYGKDGKFAGSFSSTGPSSPVTLASVEASSPSLASGFTFRVYAWHADAGYGVLSGTYSSGGGAP
jgi:hypothetical protein